MVEVEDLLDKDPGGERRVDMPKLLLYLSQMTEGMKRLDGRLTTHMNAEEAQQKHIQELVKILTSAKGLMVAVRWLIYLGAPAIAVFAWFKDNIKWH